MRLLPEQIDALREMVNIGVGHAAGVMNAMLNSRVQLHVPVVEMMNWEELQAKIQSMGRGDLSSVRLGFKGPFAGNASIVFAAESAVKLVSILTGTEADSGVFHELHESTLTEVGNIVLNGVMGAIGSELKLHVYYSLPIYVEDPLEVLLSSAQTQADGNVVWVQTSFTVETESIVGDIILVFEVGSLDLLLEAVNRAMGLHGGGRSL
jgi:chemotaxis protein CheC